MSARVKTFGVATVAALMSLTSVTADGVAPARETAAAFHGTALYSQDPLTDQQSGLEDISAPAAWSVTTGSNDVVVAVVDSGIAFEHPDIASNIWTNPGETGGGRETNGRDDDRNGYVDDWRGWDWVTDDNRPADLSGHGTHTAGVIGADGNDGFGMAGVAWDVSLMPLRALDGVDNGDPDDVTAAFRYAIAAGADIVNASLAGTDMSSELLSVIQSAPDTLFVAAAGNEQANNDFTPSYPCNYQTSNLICVAATGFRGGLANFSNYGEASVDLAAPGVAILGPVPALTQLLDDFDNGLGSWVTGGSGTQWGPATYEEDGYVTTGPYENGTDSWVSSTEPVSLAGQSDCSLNYLTQTRLGSGDVLVTEVSSVGGPWTQLAVRRFNNFDFYKSISLDISHLTGRTDLLFRFRLQADGQSPGDGVDIDDVAVECTSTVYTGEEYSGASGTSEAAPLVAGAAALLKSYAPQIKAPAMIDALVSGVDPDPRLEGLVASGGRLNVMGALEVLGAVEFIPPDIPHARSVTLKRTKKGLGGLVKVTDSFASCAAGVEVLIKRNGRPIRRLETNDSGVFRVALKVRRGRYVAVAPEVRTGAYRADVCLKASSKALKI